MDSFKIPSIQNNKDEINLFLEQQKEKRKLYDCCQLECVDRHMGLLMAFKNYWIYTYDLIQK